MWDRAALCERALKLYPTGWHIPGFIIPFHTYKKCNESKI